MTDFYTIKFDDTKKNPSTFDIRFNSAKLAFGQYLKEKNGIQSVSDVLKEAPEWRTYFLSKKYLIEAKLFFTTMGGIEIVFQKEEGKAASEPNWLWIGALGIGAVLLLRK